MDHILQPFSCISNSPAQWIAAPSRRSPFPLKWVSFPLKELAHTTNPISISPKDKAIVLPGHIIRSNSSVGTQDQVTKMSPSNVKAEGIDAIPDLNFK